MRPQLENTVGDLYTSQNLDPENVSIHSTFIC